jgi:hypothetical protein
MARRFVLENAAYLSPLTAIAARSPVGEAGFSPRSGRLQGPRGKPYQHSPTPQLFKAAAGRDMGRQNDFRVFPAMSVKADGGHFRIDAWRKRPGP